MLSNMEMADAEGIENAEKAEIVTVISENKVTIELNQRLPSPMDIKWSKIRNVKSKLQRFAHVDILQLICRMILFATTDNTF